MTAQPKLVRESFLPKELVQKCFFVIDKTHKNIGFRALPQMLTARENMVALALFPDGFTLMRSMKAASRMRLLCWVGGVALLVLTFMKTPWFSLGLILLIGIDRKLASFNRRQWTLLAAFALALEILVNRFAGWADAFPREEKEALKLLDGHRKSDLLDFYLPRWNNVDASVQAALGPSAG